MSDLRASVSSAPVDEVLARLEGELDFTSAPMLAQLIDDALSVGRPRVTLDLSGVTFIDRHALEALLQADTRARQASAELVLRSPSRRVLDLLLLTGTDGIFAVEVDLRTRREAATETFGSDEPTTLQRTVSIA
jgi:anti-sigma B factor antagonist